MIKSAIHSLSNLLTIRVESTSQWNLIQKVAFRFCFIYFMLSIAPWEWFFYIPGTGALAAKYYQGVESFLDLMNRSVFHIEYEKVQNDGSGDTTTAWLYIYSSLLFAAMGTLIWSVLKRKAQHHLRAFYALRFFLRFYLLQHCFSYGIIKLFALQMPFPNLSQLVTPLGDFLPMRLSWMFMGYSQEYQMFTGILEITAGVFLFFRRTVTLGLFFSAGIFLNVMMMNLAFDIPVKLFSMHLFLMSMFLLVLDSRRLISFFLLNKSAEPTVMYDVSWNGRPQRFASWIFKVLVLIVWVIIPFKEAAARFESLHQLKKSAIPVGIYHVESFARNNQPIPPAFNDSTRWRDVVFDHNRLGSVNSTDTFFYQRYRRGYFNYDVDTLKQQIKITKWRADSTHSFTCNYSLQGRDTLLLAGLWKNDSIKVRLVNSRKHFQLTEKQFHWVSEKNR